MRHAGHVHDENVGEPAAGSQAAILAQHRAQQFVRVQVPLHDGLGAPVRHQVHGRMGRGAMVRDIDDLDAVEAFPDRRGRRRDPVAGAHEDGRDEGVTGGEQSPAEGIGLLRRHHGGREGLQRLGARHQGVEMAVALDQKAGDVVLVVLEFGARRAHHRLAAQQQLFRLVAVYRAGEDHGAVVPFFHQPHPGHQIIARLGPPEEFEGLRAVKGAGARQDVAEHCRDQGADPHGGGRHLIGVAVPVEVVPRQVRRIVVAGRGGEHEEIVCRAHPLQLGGVAHLQFVECPVLSLHGGLASDVLDGPGEGGAGHVPAEGPAPACTALRHAMMLYPPSIWWTPPVTFAASRLARNAA